MRHRDKHDNSQLRFIKRVMLNLVLVLNHAVANAEPPSNSENPRDIRRGKRFAWRGQNNPGCKELMKLPAPFTTDGQLLI